MKRAKHTESCLFSGVCTTPTGRVIIKRSGNAVVNVAVLLVFKAPDFEGQAIELLRLPALIVEIGEWASSSNLKQTLKRLFDVDSIITRNVLNTMG